MTDYCLYCKRPIIGWTIFHKCNPIDLAIEKEFEYERKKNEIGGFY